MAGNARISNATRLSLEFDQDRLRDSKSGPKTTEYDGPNTKYRLLPRSLRLQLGHSGTDLEPA